MEGGLSAVSNSAGISVRGLVAEVTGGVFHDRDHHPGLDERAQGKDVTQFLHECDG